MKLLAKLRNWIILAIILLAGGAIFYQPQINTVFLPLGTASSGAKYLKEFQTYQYKEMGPRATPDGSIRIEEESTPKSILALFGQCHTLWLVRPNGERTILVRADELEPASGRAFIEGWSKDYRAIFVNGGYRRLDCHGSPGSFRVIYTIDDGIRWSVPG